METILDPENNTIVVNAYDDTSSATNQSFSDGGTLQYAYDDEKLQNHLMEQNGNAFFITEVEYVNIFHLTP